MALRVKQQYDVNSAGHTVSVWQEKKGEGLFITILVGAFQMNSTPRSIKEFPLSHFPSLSKGWRTAKPGSEHVVNPMIRLSMYTRDLPLQG